MTIRRLLDDRRIAVLQQRLRTLLRKAPSQGLLSITLDLDAGEGLWLNVDLNQPLTVWWAAPCRREHGQRAAQRLALGCAMSFATSGAARFCALQAAFSGLQANWLHDDICGSELPPAAHIGFAFAEESTDLFPNARLVVPAILLRNHEGRCLATFSGAVQAGESVLANWLALLHAAEVPAAPILTGRHWLPQPAMLGKQAFTARVQAALREIHSGRLDKVVVSRSIRLVSRAEVRPALVVERLTRQNPFCTTFAVGGRGQCFVGATPERLFVLQAGTVLADALAGTTWGRSMAAVLPSAAQWTDKNLREQALVENAVRAALATMCTSVDPQAAPTVFDLGQLQHLRTTVRGRLRADYGAFDLLAAVHPTPAVGGVPSRLARRWLLTHGEKRPAWYTGGIGWVDRQGNGEVVVALRCARLAGCEAELFAGAGIVAGSDPGLELAETEAKLAVMSRALCDDDVEECLRTARSARA